MPSNQTFYLPLPLKIERFGFLLLQLIRTGNFALYREIKKGQEVGYRVFKVTKVKERFFLGKHYPAQESMPWFGPLTWSVGLDLFTAIDFFRMKEKEFLNEVSTGA